MNTGLEIQLESSNPSPSRQVEAPAGVCLSGKGTDGLSHLLSSLLKAKSSAPSTALRWDLLGQGRK